MSNRNKRIRTPKLCHQKSSGLAYVTIRGKRKYLGKHGTPESEAKYQQEIHRLIAEFEGGGEYSTDINALCIAFMKWAMQHYRHEDGTQTGEVSSLSSRSEAADQTIWDDEDQRVQSLEAHPAT